MCFLQKKNGKPDKDIPGVSVSFYASVASLSKSVITPLFDIRMILVIPLIAYSGLQQAFVWLVSYLLLLFVVLLLFG